MFKRSKKSPWRKQSKTKAIAKKTAVVGAVGSVLGFAVKKARENK